MKKGKTVMLDVRFELNVSGVVEEIPDGNVGAAARLSTQLGEPCGGKRKGNWL